MSTSRHDVLNEVVPHLIVFLKRRGDPLPQTRVAFESQLQEFHDENSETKNMPPSQIIYAICYYWKLAKLKGSKAFIWNQDSVDDLVREYSGRYSIASASPDGVGKRSATDQSHLIVVGFLKYLRDKKTELPSTRPEFTNQLLTFYSDVTFEGKQISAARILFSICRNECLASLHGDRFSWKMPRVERILQDHRIGGSIAKESNCNTSDSSDLEKSSDSFNDESGDVDAVGGDDGNMKLLNRICCFWLQGICKFEQHHKHPNRNMLLLHEKRKGLPCGFGDACTFGHSKGMKVLPEECASAQPQWREKRSEESSKDKTRKTCVEEFESLESGGGQGKSASSNDIDRDSECESEEQREGAKSLTRRICCLWLRGKCKFKRDHLHPQRKSLLLLHEDRPGLCCGFAQDCTYGHFKDRVRMARDCGLRMVSSPARSKSLGDSRAWNMSNSYATSEVNEDEDVPDDECNEDSAPLQERICCIWLVGKCTRGRSHRHPHLNLMLLHEDRPGLCCGFAENCKYGHFRERLGEAKQHRLGSTKYPSQHQPLMDGGSRAQTSEDDPWHLGGDPWQKRDATVGKAMHQDQTNQQQDASTEDRREAAENDPWHLFGDPWQQSSMNKTAARRETVINGRDQSQNTDGMIEHPWGIPRTENGWTPNRFDKASNWKRSSSWAASRAKSADATTISEERQISKSASEREQDAMDYREHLRSYDLADFVKYKNRHRVFPEKILRAFPDSLAADYFKNNGRPNLRFGEGVPDYDVLNFVTPNKIMSPQDTLVLHLRTGDVCEKNGHNPHGTSHEALSARHLLTKTVNPYVKPLHFFREVAVLADERCIERVTIITDKLEPGSVSEEYVNQVAEFFRTGKSPYSDLGLKSLQKSWPNSTTVCSATCPRYWAEVDNHFCIGANAKAFATTGGGFGEVISKLVEMRGGKVFSPTFNMPEHVKELNCISESDAKELHSLGESKANIFSRSDGHTTIGVASNADQARLDFELLCDWLCKNISDVSPLRETAEQMHELQKIVFDLGRPPRFFFGKTWRLISMQNTTEMQLNELEESLIKRAGKCGIPNTLHQVVTVRTSDGDLCGLTVHVHYANIGVANCLQDVLAKHRSLLIVGSHGSEKKALLRDIARMLSLQPEEDVLVVDHDDTIGGIGKESHISLGFARRLNWPQNEKPSFRTLATLASHHSPVTIAVDDPRIFQGGDMHEWPSCHSSIRLVCTVEEALDDLLRRWPQCSQAFAGAVILEGCHVDKFRVIEDLATGPFFSLSQD